MSESTSPRDEGARLLQQGDVPGAIGKLQEAVMQDSKDAQAFSYLGIAYVRHGNLDAGVRALQGAASLQPDDPQIRYNLALALQHAHRPDEARTELLEVLRTHPEHTNARQLLARLGAGPAPVEAPPGRGAVPTQDYPASNPSTAYGTPGAVVTPAEPIASNGGAGLEYRVEHAAEGDPPSAGRRILRGLMWGPVYGQWWTLWSLISLVIFRFSSLNPTDVLIEALVYLIGYGFFGSLAGLIIGATGARENVAAGIGIGVGMLVMVLEYLLTGSAFQFINVFFYFITGRFVGAGLETRVHEPVR